MNARTRAVVLTFLLLLHLPTSARAIWMGMSLQDAVTTADVIVVATLRDVRGYRMNGYDVREGWLDVERSLWGSNPGDSLPLRWRNPVNLACPRVDNGQFAGRSALWVLTREADGFHADHPDRVRPATDLEAVLDTLAAYPYQIVKRPIDVGEPVSVELVFRNATGRPLTVPAVKAFDGRLTCGDGFRVVAEAPLRNVPIQDDKSLPPVILSPGRSVSTEIPFLEPTEKERSQLYRFEIRMNGRGVRHGVEVRSAWRARWDRVRDTPEELPFYVQTLRNGGEGVSGALMMLGMLRSGLAAVAPELLRLCDSLETDTRIHVMKLVQYSDIAPETLLDFMLARVEDPSSVVRAVACGGAGAVCRNQALENRREEVVVLLMNSLGDGDPGVRCAAIRALAGLQAETALPSLEALARFDGNPETRMAARNAIDDIQRLNPYVKRPRNSK